MYTTILTIFVIGIVTIAVNIGIILYRQKRKQEREWEIKKEELRKKYLLDRINKVCNNIQETKRKNKLYKPSSKNQDDKIDVNTLKCLSEHNYSLDKIEVYDENDHKLKQK